MSSVNKVILVGNVGSQPEIKSFSNGGKCASFSIATSEKWKDKATGEKKEKTEWHRVVVFNENIVGVVEKYVNKGDKLYLEGQLETRKWSDKDGVEKYSTEIVIRPYKGEVVLLGAPKQASPTLHDTAKSNAYQPQPNDDQTIPF